VLLGLAGCGRATVRCSTPIGQLDRSRQETASAREEADRAAAEEEAWGARREAASERVKAIKARLDSLASEHHH
jgi:hypothetical protein